jgi:hypothetical protein
VSAALVVAAITGIFFVIGLVVGGIVVTALPVLRDRRRTRTGSGNDTMPAEYHHVADDRPRWPRDPDTNYPRR